MLLIFIALFKSLKNHSKRQNKKHCSFGVYNCLLGDIFFDCFGLKYKPNILCCSIQLGNYIYVLRCYRCNYVETKNEIFDQIGIIYFHSIKPTLERLNDLVISLRKKQFSENIYTQSGLSYFQIINGYTTFNLFWLNYVWFTQSKLFNNIWYKTQVKLCQKCNTLLIYNTINL